MSRTYRNFQKFKDLSFRTFNNNEAIRRKEIRACSEIIEEGLTPSNRLKERANPNNRTAIPNRWEDFPISAWVEYNFIWRNDDVLGSYINQD